MRKTSKAEPHPETPAEAPPATETVKPNGHAATSGAADSPQKTTRTTKKRRKRTSEEKLKAKLRSAEEKLKAAEEKRKAAEEKKKAQQQNGSYHTDERGLFYEEINPV